MQRWAGLTLKRRRPWYQYVVVAVAVTLAGAFLLMVTLTMLFMLIYGW